MAETSPQKDAMDVLQAWVDDYNERSGAAIGLDSGGEAGGAQLRLKYAPSEDTIAILHLVAVLQGVFAVAAIVVLTIIGLAFGVGYIVGKILL